MKVNALDHVNIITEDLTGTASFFADIFELDIRDGPEPLPREHVQWLYDDQDRAIFHINSTDMPQAFQRDIKAGPGTGAIHHIALNCSDLPAFLEKLESHGMDYKINDIPSVNLKQLFFCEPNGVLLELNFYGE